jgi:hypothetical protein
VSWFSFAGGAPRLLEFSRYIMLEIYAADEINLYAAD